MPPGRRRTFGSRTFGHSALKTMASNISPDGPMSGMWVPARLPQHKPVRSGCHAMTASRVVRRGSTWGTRLVVFWLELARPGKVCWASGRRYAAPERRVGGFSCCLWFRRSKIDAYLNGLILLPPLECDLIAQAANELIDEISPLPCAPYWPTSGGSDVRRDDRNHRSHRSSRKQELSMNTPSRSAQLGLDSLLAFCKC